MKWELSSKRIGKYFWALPCFCLFLLLVCPPAMASSLSPRVEESSAFSLVGSTPAPSPMPTLPPLPEIQTTPFPSSMPLIQKLAEQLKNWDTLWSLEIIWRQLVKDSWQAMLTSFDNQNKVQAETIATLRAEIDGLKLSNKLMADKMATVDRDKGLIGGSSFLGGLILGAWAGRSLK